MNVITLDKNKELQSKYDFVLSGKTVRFVVEGCSCKDAVMVKFMIEVKAIDVVPSFLKHSIDQNQIVKETVCEDHIALKWYEKLVGRTLKTKVEKWAKHHNKRLKNIHESDVRAKELQNLIG